MTLMRLVVGFVAGFLSVLIFQMATIALLQAAGVAFPFAAWSMEPVPPFGVPLSLSAAFWGGLWGIVYALLEPKLTARLGWAVGGLVFGILPVLVLWIVVLPLKGLPVAGGFTLPGMLIGIIVHVAFGFGTALFFRLGCRLIGRRDALSPAGSAERPRH
jgi:hypothetical protein